MPSSKPDWPYDVGKFVCHQCGNCCRGDGYVELSEGDIRRMAKLFELSRSEFLDTYAKFDRPSGTWNLVDQSDELQSCIFLEKDNSCRVHAVKPLQCRNFPEKWRPDNIADFCQGWRDMVGLPPPDKKTMT